MQIPCCRQYGLGYYLDNTTAWNNSAGGSWWAWLLWWQAQRYSKSFLIGYPHKNLSLIGYIFVMFSKERDDQNKNKHVHQAAAKLLSNFMALIYVWHSFDWTNFSNDEGNGVTMILRILDWKTKKTRLISNSEFR